MADLTGHTERILHMALSPDQSTVVSAAADETLRLWKCWEVDPASLKKSGAENKLRRRKDSRSDGLSHVYMRWARIVELLLRRAYFEDSAYHRCREAFAKIWHLTLFFNCIYHRTITTCLPIHTLSILDSHYSTCSWRTLVCRWICTVSCWERFSLHASIRPHCAWYSCWTTSRVCFVLSQFRHEDVFVLSWLCSENFNKEFLRFYFYWWADVIEWFLENALVPHYSERNLRARTVKPACHLVPTFSKHACAPGPLIQWNSVIMYPQGKWKKVRSNQNTFYPIENAIFLTGRTGSTYSRERSATEDASPSWMWFIIRFSYGEIAFQGIVNLKMCREIEIETERLDDMCSWRENWYVISDFVPRPVRLTCFPIGDVRDRRRERYNRVYVLSRVRTNRVSLYNQNFVHRWFCTKIHLCWVTTC